MKGSQSKSRNLTLFDEGSGPCTHQGLSGTGDRGRVRIPEDKPSTYKNVLQLNLYRSHSIAYEFTCPYLCYINYPNRKMRTSIYANKEHQKQLFAYVLGSRGWGWISSSPEWRTTSSDNIVGYMRPDSTR